MISSKHSSQRQIVPRPPVCHPPPQKQAPPCTCGLNPSWNTFFHWIQLDLPACNNLFPADQQVQVAVDVSPPLPKTIYQQPKNCTQHGAGFLSGSVPGTAYQITATYTFSDQSTCQAFATFSY